MVIYRNDVGLSTAMVYARERLYVGTTTNTARSAAPNFGADQVFRQKSLDHYRGAVLNITAVIRTVVLERV
jgi:hypothetical protein